MGTPQKTDRAALPVEEEKGIVDHAVMLGGIEVGLPDTSKPLAVTHYINSHMEQIWRAAKFYASSGLVPDRLKDNQAATFTVLTTGLELGLGYATSLRTIHVWSGKPTLSADLMMGLAMQVGTTFQWLRNDATGARIAWERGGSSGEVEFTVEDARKAGLTVKDNWTKYPGQMCAQRCQAIASRRAAPDRLGGLYTDDELEGLPEVDRSGGQATLPSSRNAATYTLKQVVATLARSLGWAENQIPGDDIRPHLTFTEASGVPKLLGLAPPVFLKDLSDGQAQTVLNRMREEETSRKEAQGVRNVSGGLAQEMAPDRPGGDTHHSSSDASQGSPVPAKDSGSASTPAPAPARSTQVGKPRAAGKKPEPRPVCAGCGRTIIEGQAMKSRKEGQWFHADCFEDGLPPEPAPVEEDLGPKKDPREPNERRQIMDYLHNMEPRTAVLDGAETVLLSGLQAVRAMSGGYPVKTTPGNEVGVCLDDLDNGRLFEFAQKVVGS